ncbi:MAG: glyceraldehyde 3-phosphate dehydrogenase NAD-binding domain-containing protein [Thalassovita sp.]|nr:glyceraldehyde 3-phosphate dehydrogenase NAD-binding domain-containing protein [Thalassovita sp.]
MTRPVRVFINGFGRIGRTLLRQLLQGQGPERLEVVGINDIAPLETCAYLLRYDSVYGLFPSTVEAGQNCLRIGGKSFPFFSEPDLRKLDLRDVDVVLECTGKANDRAAAAAGIEAGASKVLISGPSSAADRTIVIGANDHELGDARIVSNASCTTNAIAPLLRTLDLELGIERAHITTIHCYTGSQPTVDQPGASLERSRAAAVSMVPTTTSAAAQVINVLPEFQGHLSVAAVRVPCISVSAIDATLQIADTPSEPFVEFLKKTFAGSSLIGLTEDPCVSTDFRARSESLVIALPETQPTGHRQLRLFGWYDNEWGFSARMIEMAERLSVVLRTET